MFEILVFSEIEADILHSAFVKKVLSIIRLQDQRIGTEKQAAEPCADYWEHIRTCYRNHKIKVADNCDEYQDGFHDAVIPSNCLCIRGEWLNTTFPKETLIKSGTYIAQPVQRNI